MECHFCALSLFCVLSTFLHLCVVKEVGVNTGFSWLGVTHAVSCTGLGAGFRTVLDSMVPHASLLVGW